MMLPKILSCSYLNGLSFATDMEKMRLWYLSLPSHAANHIKGLTQLKTHFSETIFLWDL